MSTADSTTSEKKDKKSEGPDHMQRRRKGAVILPALFGALYGGALGSTRGVLPGTRFGNMLGGSLVGGGLGAAGGYGALKLRDYFGMDPLVSETLKTASTDRHGSRLGAYGASLLPGGPIAYGAITNPDDRWAGAGKGMLNSTAGALGGGALGTIVGGSLGTLPGRNRLRELIAALGGGSLGAFIGAGEGTYRSGAPLTLMDRMQRKLDSWDLPEWAKGASTDRQGSRLAAYVANMIPFGSTIYGGATNPSNAIGGAARGAVYGTLGGMGGSLGGGLAGGGLGALIAQLLWRRPGLGALAGGYTGIPLGYAVGGGEATYRSGAPLALTDRMQRKMASRELPEWAKGASHEKEAFGAAARGVARMLPGGVRRGAFNFMRGAGGRLTSHAGVGSKAYQAGKHFAGNKGKYLLGGLGLNELHTQLVAKPRSAMRGAQAGAEAVAANTQDALRNLPFAQRLGYLFSPDAFADRYGQETANRLQSYFG